MVLSRATSLPSRYALGPRIGQGGTADVFRASATEAHGFSRTVVIKRIRADLECSPEIAAMFAAEANIVRRLQHGGIAQLFDFGFQDGAPYLVLEHVEGVSLDGLRAHAHASGRELAIADALCVVEQVAAALAYAHRLRDDDGLPLALVHRDVTPRNILVSSEGVVKLTDFGLARVGKPIAMPRTMPGVVKGTFGYMSPEQARGAPIDGRSDQFSLGVVLYELLAGDNPLGDATTLADAVKLLSRPLPAIAELDRALADIVARATAIDPRRRFPTTGDFGAALEQWRGERHVRLSPEALAAAVLRARGHEPITVHRLDEALPHYDRARGATVVARPPATERRAHIAIGLAAIAVIIAAIIMIAGTSGSGSDRDGSTPITVAAIPMPEVAPHRPPPSTAIVPEPAPAPRVRRAASVADGRLKINVLPWAAVQLDGRVIGHTPVDVAVAVGAHDIVLFNPDTGRRKEHRIEIRRNRVAEIKSW